jgi:hypothetical protein
MHVRRLLIAPLMLPAVAAAASPQVYEPPPLQLKRVPPNEFRAEIDPLALTLVLFCQASEIQCERLEQQLAGVAVRLAAERSPALLHMVDTTEWGGEALRLQYGALSTPMMPELILFRGGIPTVYDGRRDADAIQDYLTAASEGKLPLQSHRAPTESKARASDTSHAGQPGSHIKERERERERERAAWRRAHRLGSPARGAHHALFPRRNHPPPALPSAPTHLPSPLLLAPVCVRACVPARSRCGPRGDAHNAHRPP